MFSNSIRYEWKSVSEKQIGFTNRIVFYKACQSWSIPRRAVREVLGAIAIFTKRCNCWKNWSHDRFKPIWIGTCEGVADPSSGSFSTFYRQCKKHVFAIRIAFFAISSCHLLILISPPAVALLRVFPGVGVPSCGGGFAGARLSVRCRLLSCKFSYISAAFGKCMVVFFCRSTIRA